MVSHSNCPKKISTSPGPDVTIGSSCREAHWLWLTSTLVLFLCWKISSYILISVISRRLVNQEYIYPSLSWNGIVSKYGIPFSPRPLIPLWIETQLHIFMSHLIVLISHLVFLPLISLGSTIMSHPNNLRSMIGDTPTDRMYKSPHVVDDWRCLF